jgi:dihydrofolate reductase
VNIVLSHTPHDSAEGVIWAADLDEALLHLEQTGADEVFIIGGGEIYAQAIGRADRLYLTEVAAEVEADTWFPPFDPAGWAETWRWEHPADAANPFGMVFRRLERVKRNST